MMKKILLSLTLVLSFGIIISHTLFSQTVNVTFKVDMQEQVVDPNGVHIAGTFQGWDPTATAMTNLIGSVWQYTTAIDAGSYIEYKFVNGNTWPQAESIFGPCSPGSGNTNRFYNVPTSDVAIPAVCFGSCFACILPTVDITFQVDMSNEVVSPNGIHIAGSFQNWDPAADQLTDQGGGIYTITLALEEGTYHEYKFLNGNAWGSDESVPPACATNNNRTITVPSANETLPLVCFGSCSACVTVTDINVTFKVDMTQQVVDPLGVHITGSFQGWNPASTLMNDMGNGIWEYSFVLQSGTYHEYKFVNGNAWGMDESVPWYCAQNNNRNLVVPNNDSILPAVCYSLCLVCNPPQVDITFKVDMSLQQVSPNGVHLTGSFQGWDPSSTLMNDIGNNHYEITLPVGIGEFHEYKFVNGNTFDGAEFVPGECSGFGGNREFFGPSANTIFDEVCFGSCATCVIPTHTFNFKAILEGPFNGTSMDAKIDAAGLIPTDQPYNTAPWNYAGTENITIAPPIDIVDWVLVELRSTPGDSASATSDRMFHRFAGLLKTDGSIVGTDGVMLPEYTGPIFDNLYVVIYHRNHLPVMSSNALTPTDGAYVYDFTTAQTQAYGDVLKDIGGGVFGLIGGDSDANGTIDVADKDNGWSVDAGNKGYFMSDLNLDAEVNNPDKADIWETNVGTTAVLPVPVYTACGDIFTDPRDNHQYPTVMIGTQCWMAKNLNYGTMVAGSTGQSNNSVHEKFCYGDLSTNCDEFGGLFQWNEIMEYTTIVGTQGVCPAGWHIPSDAQWQTLSNFLGGDLAAGAEMKETGTNHWLNPNTGATNSSGFTAFGGGRWNSSGYFHTQYQYGLWWSSTQTLDNTFSWMRGIYHQGVNLNRDFNLKEFGISVRCLAD